VATGARLSRSSALRLLFPSTSTAVKFERGHDVSELIIAFLGTSTSVSGSRQRFDVDTPSSVAAARLLGPEIRAMGMH
jgi:hypothetical protein